MSHLIYLVQIIQDWEKGYFFWFWDTHILYYSNSKEVLVVFSFPQSVSCSPAWPQTKVEKDLKPMIILASTIQMLGLDMCHRWFLAGLRNSELVHTGWGLYQVRYILSRYLLQQGLKYTKKMFYNLWLR